MADPPLESLGNLLRGSGKSTVTVEFLPGEVEVVRAIGNYRNVTGGELVLTNKRLVFAPWNVADVADVLTWMLDKSGAPGPAGEAVGAARDAVGGVREAGAIRLARRGRDASLLRPPTVIVDLADGTHSEFGVLHTKLAMSMDSRNNDARDELITQINAVFGR
jgi:hypothetical protein